MFFASLLQLFFFLAGSAHPAPESLSVPQTASAAAAPSVEIISGVESSLQMVFNHSLPVATVSKSFGPRRIPSESLGILTSAESALIVDERTWSVLFDKNTSERRPLASITKLMTGLVVLDEGLEPSRRVVIQKSDYRAGGIIHVFNGEETTMQDLWMLALIPSDNVAAAALVRATGLSQEEFVARMNAKAVELGMANTTFVEPTGISELNTSTAADVALLLQEAMRHVEITDAVRRPVYTFEPFNKKGVRTARSTNELLTSFVNRDPYAVVGGKTGFTYEAGYCLAVVIDGPNPADNVIVVLMGAPSNDDRFQEVKGLVDWAYANYEW